MPHHPELGGGEGDEHPDDVELDEPRHLGVERDDQRHGADREEDDPVGEHEPVAPGVELARQELVPGEDRTEHREAVERRVGRQDQDEAGDGGDQVEHHRQAGEHGLRDLPDHGALVVGLPHRGPVQHELLGG